MPTWSGKWRSWACECRRIISRCTTRPWRGSGFSTKGYASAYEVMQSLDCGRVLTKPELQKVDIRLTHQAAIPSCGDGRQTTICRGLVSEADTHLAEISAEFPG